MLTGIDIVHCLFNDRRLLSLWLHAQVRLDAVSSGVGFRHVVLAVVWRQ